MVENRDGPGRDAIVAGEDGGDCQAGKHGGGLGYAQIVLDALPSGQGSQRQAGPGPDDQQVGPRRRRGGGGGGATCGPAGLRVERRGSELTVIVPA